jgi:hypothetical protein
MQGRLVHGAIGGAGDDRIRRLLDRATHRLNQGAHPQAHLVLVDGKILLRVHLGFDRALWQSHPAAGASHEQRGNHHGEEHRGPTAACAGVPGAMVHGSTSEDHVSHRQHTFRLLALSARLLAVAPHVGQDNHGSPSQARLPSARIRHPAPRGTRRWIVQHAPRVPMRCSWIRHRGTQSAPWHHPLPLHKGAFAAPIDRTRYDDVK